MLKPFTRLVRRVLPLKVRVAIEWPRHCDGWKLPELAALRQLLPRTRDFDGCACGLKSRLAGKPVFKPWRVVSNHPGLDSALGRRCSRRHEHAPRLGAD
eukprot:9476885-Lingulodinium_polyedra.AAC.1